MQVPESRHKRKRSFGGHQQAQPHIPKQEQVSYEGMLYVCGSAYADAWRCLCVKFRDNTFYTIEEEGGEESVLAELTDSSRVYTVAGLLDGAYAFTLSVNGESGESEGESESGGAYVVFAARTAGDRALWVEALHLSGYESTVTTAEAVIERVSGSKSAGKAAAESDDDGENENAPAYSLTSSVVIDKATGEKKTVDVLQITALYSGSLEGVGGVVDAIVAAADEKLGSKVAEALGVPVGADIAVLVSPNDPSAIAEATHDSISILTGVDTTVSSSLAPSRYGTEELEEDA